MAPTMSSTATMKKRFQSFLIWQSLQSTSLFLLTKLSLFLFLFLSPFTHQHATSSSSGTPFPLLFGRLLSFLCFLVSMLVFSTCVHFISTPQFRRPALPPSLAFAFIRILFADSSSLATDDFLSRTRSSLCVVLLVSVSSLSGFVAVVSIANGGSFTALGLRGFCLGFVYGVYCVFTHRSVLTFPIVQRPPFFSYKMELLSAFRRALKLSVASLVVLILTYQHKSSIAEQCIFYLASYTVLLSWELIFQLHKILHTKRFVFAPSKGSAAVETNPSEFLLTALEGSYPRSLLQYLAYLDLCMVCGSNIDLWRRAAFFEETGETYKRVVTACLRPLQQFTLELAEGLKSSADNINKLSHQLSSPNEICRSSEILESFSDFQLYAWCAQAVASLEVRSHKEDRFGVAQLSGSHVMVLSTLLSCLLAVEASMGKKINLQSPNHIMGPAGIKWATNSTARREIATAMNKKRGSHSHTKSYALADVLKISIYSIVSEFLEEMHTSAKMGLLEKDWLSSGKPVYGSSELLLQKLQFFLNFQAS